VYVYLYVQVCNKSVSPLTPYNRISVVLKPVGHKEIQAYFCSNIILPGSVADMMAPNIKQSINCNELRSKTQNAYIRPLQ